MTIITQIKAGLEGVGYEVYLNQRTKISTKEIIMVLDEFEYEVESPTSYLANITIGIWMVERDVDVLIDKILKVSTTIENSIEGNPRFRLLSPELFNEDGQLYKVVLPIKYTEVLNIG